MKIEYVEVNNPFLTKYVDFYYFLSTVGDATNTNYLAFPLSGNPLAFFKNAAAEKVGDKIDVKSADAQATSVSLVGNFVKPLEISFEPNILEFSIVFKPLGINFFVPGNLGKELSQDISTVHFFDDLLPLIDSLIDGVGELEELENALIAKFASNRHLKMLDSTIKKLQDPENQSTEHQIAKAESISSKQLFRLFKTHLGVNPSQYRQLLRFRTALDSSIRNLQTRSLTEIGLGAGYYDQPHFIKEFKKITNLAPRDFLSKVSLEANDKIVWQFFSEMSDSYN